MPARINEKYIIKQLCTAVAAMDETATISWAVKASEKKINLHLLVHEGLCRGLEIVSEKYETGEYILPQLVDLSKLLDTTMSILNSGGIPAPDVRQQVIVMGVVEGDIHDIGKNILKLMLTPLGFRIIDMGRDVPIPLFVQTAIREKADMICISSSLSTTLPGISQVMNQLKSNGVNGDIKLIVGGDAVSEAFAARIGADGYAPSAGMGVKLIKSLLTEKD